MSPSPLRVPLQPRLAPQTKPTFNLPTPTPRPSRLQQRKAPPVKSRRVKAQAVKDPLVKMTTTTRTMKTW